jgi:hypothetical protein
VFVGEALVGNEAVDQLSKFNQAMIDYAVVWIENISKKMQPQIFRLATE